MYVMDYGEELRVIRVRILSDTIQGNEFWTCHGTIVRNIYELKNTINGLSESDFRYHVNEDNTKNDFADWVYGAVGDTYLAHLLKGVMDKKKYIRIIEDRINQLEDA